MKNSAADRNNALSSCAGLFINAHHGFDFPGIPQLVVSILRNLVGLGSGGEELFVVSLGVAGEGKVKFSKGIE